MCRERRAWLSPRRRCRRSLRVCCSQLLLLRPAPRLAAAAAGRLAAVAASGQLAESAAACAAAAGWQPGRPPLAAGYRPPTPSRRRMQGRSRPATWPTVLRSCCGRRRPPGLELLPPRRRQGSRRQTLPVGAAQERRRNGGRVSCVQWTHAQATQQRAAGPANALTPLSSTSAAVLTCAKRAAAVGLESTSG